MNLIKCRISSFITVRLLIKSRSCRWLLLFCSSTDMGYLYTYDWQVVPCYLLLVTHGDTINDKQHECLYVQDRKIVVFHQLLSTNASGLDKRVGKSSGRFLQKQQISNVLKLTLAWWKLIKTFNLFFSRPLALSIKNKLRNCSDKIFLNRPTYNCLRNYPRFNHCKSPWHYVTLLSVFDHIKKIKEIVFHNWN